MAGEGIDSRLAEQLQTVADRAGELFTDLMEEHARKGKMNIGSIAESDKRTIERLFSDVVYGHIIAETSAIVSVLIHSRLKDDSILTVVVPSFLDRCEGKMELAADTVARKTSGLAVLATGVLESRPQKGGLVSSLLDDLMGRAEPGRLRASFDAVALSLLGE